MMQVILFLLLVVCTGITSAVSTVDGVCPYAKFNGTCKNFQPLQDCIFTVLAVSNQCEILSKTKCTSSLQFLDKSCYNACVQFHTTCCCPALSHMPTTQPTNSPVTSKPTTRPTPTRKPSPAPTKVPTVSPSKFPTVRPSISKAPVTSDPTYEPWARPTHAPTSAPVPATSSPTQSCPFFWDLFGPTITCKAFWEEAVATSGLPKAVVQPFICEFDSAFEKTGRCGGMSAFKCQQKFPEYDRECRQKCTSFHTLCCCGIS